MISQDKYGKPIYPYIFEILKKQGDILVSVGYIESKNKPNLFYRKDEFTENGFCVIVIFFADMRSSEVVPIWEDTNPLFYWKFEADNEKDYQLPSWIKRKIISNEMNNLEEFDIHVRLSFYEEYESDGLFFYENESNGFCHFCQQEIFNDKLFCSEICEKKAKQQEELQLERWQERCYYCGKMINSDTAIRHHISYEPEVIKEICRSCHMKIIRNGKHDIRKVIKNENQAE
jgi:hypothetical protein